MDAKLAELCSGLGDKAADQDGFVALHRLLHLLKADIEFRPLLVEGIIASPKGEGQWRILVDSETHGTGEGFLTESVSKPLPPRLRNTVCHELLHTLSFRAEEFGFTLPKEKNESRADTVRRLERETESFSPLLLISQSALNKAVVSEGITLENLLRWRNRWSVSREVLISRVKLAQQLADSDLRHHAELNNLMLLVGEWISPSQAKIREWPIFIRFADGIVPEFTWSLRNKEPVLSASLFTEPDFYLNGGTKNITTIETKAGTQANPKVEQLILNCSVEQTPRRKGERFLIFIEGKDRAETR